MAYQRYTGRDSFFWNSNLSDERKDQILAWVRALRDEEVDCLNDLLKDVQDDENFDCTYQG